MLIVSGICLSLLVAMYFVWFMYMSTEQEINRLKAAINFLTKPFAKEKRTNRKGRCKVRINLKMVTIEWFESWEPDEKEDSTKQEQGK